VRLARRWLADQVLLKIACVLMRWLFSLAALMSRGDREKDAELPALRHENAVLRRNVSRIRYEPGDRAWFTVLTRFVPRRRRAEVFPVTPMTLPAWQRRIAGSPPGKRLKPGSGVAWRTSAGHLA
jgi:putative transposase